MSGIGSKIQAPPTAALQAAASPQTTATGAASAKTGDAKRREDAAKAGREFEAILVRQMLAQTKIAGKAGGYGDMAVEALATSVTQAGGLGMGRAIEDSLAGGHAPHPMSSPVVGSLAKPASLGALPQTPRSSAPIDLKKPVILNLPKK